MQFPTNAADLYNLLGRHISTAIGRASDVFPGAYGVAISAPGEPPTIMVLGPEGIEVPATYSFEIDGAVHTVPAWHSVQAGVNKKMLEKQVKAKQQKKAA